MEEQKWSSETFTKLINEGFRNAMVCATVAAAGAAIIRYPQLSIFGPAAAPWLGLVLLLCGSTLVLWNVIQTVLQLFPGSDLRKRIFWIRDVPTAIVLVVVHVGVFGVAAQFHAHGLKSFMEPATKMASAHTPRTP